jgi:uncharacterized protein (DUF697 family)
MSKKKLPNAIMRNKDEPPLAAGEGELDLPVASHAVDAETSPLSRESLEAIGATALVVPPTGRTLVRRRPPDSVNAVRRLTQAEAIVERHATYAAAGGLVPVPLVNVASVTAIILRMVRMLSRLYGVPFERDRARAIVVGLAGGAMPTGIAAVASSTVQYLIPASALLGLVVSSVTAVACTRSIGRVFVAHFEAGESLTDFPTVRRG